MELIGLHISFYSNLRKVVVIIFYIFDICKHMFSHKVNHIEIYFFFQFIKNYNDSKFT